MTVQKFEGEIKNQIVSDRLRDLITGGITVSDAEVRSDYRKQGTKIKFDYAVLSADDLRKTINPTDTELQAFFKQNAAHYRDALPETRKIEYVAFSDKDLPGGKPQITAGRDPAVLQPESAAVQSRCAGEGPPHPHLGRSQCRRGCRRGGKSQGAGHPRPDPQGRRQELRRTGEEELRRPRQQGPGRRAGLDQARRHRPANSTPPPSRRSPARSPASSAPASATTSSRPRRSRTPTPSRSPK